MIKKLLTFSLLIFLLQIKAQNEFITLWKPYQTAPITVNAPVQAGSNEIWFPGIGENYTISWEEVNYPQHNGILTNVTSTRQVLINFGNAINPDPTNATYIVKASNGNGVFRQIRFATGNTAPGGSTINFWEYNGSPDKILEIRQWGNIQWNSMHAAFSSCLSLQLAATDAPDLSNVNDASYMFYNISKFNGSPSIANWNTSTIKNFKYIFGHFGGQTQLDTFNPPIGSWNTSSAEDMSYMFHGRRQFNQNLNSWNISNVTDISYMFAETNMFNQPLDNWNTTKVQNMTFLFHTNPNFNQPINSWKISSATNISHMFHGCVAFNQPLSSWDTTKVTDINTMFTGATSFNQNLGSWNLPALTNAMVSLANSGLNCENYSKTISGWAQNPNTASNINLGPLVPLMYSVDVSDKRNILINKGWIFSNDVIGECRMLGVSESSMKNQASISPNPAQDYIYINNMPSKNRYVIFDASGRMIAKDIFIKDAVNIEYLTPGNYILQVISKENIQSFKFIKK